MVPRTEIDSYPASTPPAEMLEQMLDGRYTRVPIYDEDIDQMTGELESAFASGDAGEVHRVSHSLKGMVGNYCAEQAFEQARLLDDRARAGNLEGARECLGPLLESTQALRGALRDFARSLGNS